MELPNQDVKFILLIRKGLAMKYKEDRLMSMEFRSLIDKENIILDSKMLAEFNKRNELNNKIDKLVLEFIATRELTEFEEIDLVYSFAEKIKDRL